MPIAREVGDRTMPFPKTIADLGVAIHPQSNEVNLAINGTSGISLIRMRCNLELPRYEFDWCYGCFDARRDALSLPEGVKVK